MPSSRLNKLSESDREAFLLAHRCPTGRLGREVAEDMNSHHLPLREWGLNLASFPAEARLLEAACGGGMTARSLLRERGVSSLVGFDLSEEMAQFSRQINREEVDNSRAVFLTADVSNLPFADSSFDGALAFETIYFWPDLARGIRELIRTLRPGGPLLIVNELYRYQELTDEEEGVIELLEMEVLTPDGYLEVLAKAGLKNLKATLHPDQPWIALTGCRTSKDNE